MAVNTVTPTVIDGNLVINGAVVAPASEVAGYEAVRQTPSSTTWRVRKTDGTVYDYKVVEGGAPTDVYTKAEVDAKIAEISTQTISGVSFDDETGEIVIETE